MADEIRVVANQRFDLIDMVRLKQAIQEALADVLGNILGNPENYSGAARDTNFRPLLACNFRFTIVPPMSIQVDQYYTIAGVDYEALIYDSDGYRLTGPNAVTPKVFVSAMPGAGTWYLMVRRLPVDTSLESRKHYSAALGEYSANINTRTYDDWELHEDIVPAVGNVALRNAGWVDIAMFTTNAVPNVNSVGAKVPTGMDILLNPLTWTGAATLPDRDVLNVFEWLGALTQIVRRMRYGSDSVAPLNSRDWYHNPIYDACFDDKGGVRLVENGVGLSVTDVFLRLLTGAPTQATLGNEALPDADGLRHLRVRSCIVGDLTNGGAPNTTVGPSGFIYATVPNGVANPIIVSKYWDLDQLLPKQTLWNGAPTNRYWDLGVGGGGVNVTPIWQLYTNAAGAETSMALYGRIKVPHLCRIYSVELQMWVITAFPVPGVTLTCSCDVIRFDRTTGLDTVLSHHTYLNATGAPWSTGGYAPAVLAYSEPADGVLLVNNYTYEYWVSVYLDTSGVIGPNYYIGVNAGRVLTHIREASQIY